VVVFSNVSAFGDATTVGIGDAVGRELGVPVGFGVAPGGRVGVGVGTGVCVGVGTGVGTGVGAVVGDGDGTPVAPDTVTVCAATLAPGTFVLFAEIVAAAAPVPPEYESVTTVAEFGTVDGFTVNVPVVSEFVMVMGYS
jgi:hypothetical protein